MYKPFGYETIPEHLQGYRIIPANVSEKYPNYKVLTKKERTHRYKESFNSSYADYNGPFK